MVKFLRGVYIQHTFDKEFSREYIMIYRLEMKDKHVFHYVLITNLNQCAVNWPAFRVVPVIVDDSKMINIIIHQK